MNKIEIIDLHDTQALIKEINKNGKVLKGNTALIFTQEEINSMPKTFRTDFKTKKIKAHVRKHRGSYEVRCQWNGVKYCAVAKTITEAKEKFIAQIKKAFPDKKPKNTLSVYARNWLETVKKPYIKENTYASYMQVFNTYIVPNFGDKDLSALKPIEIQKVINEFAAAGKNRTAKALYQVLKPLFDYAVADGVITLSPMTKVIIPVYEEQKGTALTRAEEKTLITAFTANPTIVAQAFVFVLYTGLRRAELPTVKVSDKWITAINAKSRKGKKEKTKSIPISPLLKKYLPKININAITKLSPEKLTKALKTFLPTHHLHDLRHTFITRCQECGIPREIVSLWAGHAADTSITSRVYTHLEQNEDLQIAEISKFIYDFE